MKIVNLKKFRALPNGTVFSKYEPCVFRGLMIKVDICDSDFFYQNLICEIGANDTYDFFDKCNDKMEQGESVDIYFDCTERDGLYDEDQLFAVYEKKDLDGLISRLQKAKQDLINGG